MYTFKNILKRQWMAQRTILKFPNKICCTKLMSYLPLLMNFNASFLLTVAVNQQPTFIFKKGCICGMKWLKMFTKLSCATHCMIFAWKPSL